MKTSKLCLAALFAGTVGVVSADDTNTWFNLTPSEWSVNDSTREWSKAAANGATITEVNTNGEAMTTQKNKVEDAKLQLSTAGGFLVYNPGATSTNDANAVVFVDLTVKFNAAKTLKTDGFKTLPGGRKAQGAMSMFKHDDGSFAFAGLDYENGEYVWRELAGVTPATVDAEYAVRMVRTYSNDVQTVAYFAKEADAYKPLAYNEKTAFAIPSEANYLSLLGFRGNGTVANAGALMTVVVPGIGIVVVNPDGSVDTTVYASIDEAIAAKEYGSSVTVQKVLADGETVTLAPGVKVTFAAGQQVGAGHLIVQGPAGVDWYDVTSPKDGEYALALNEKAKPTIADDKANDKKAIDVAADEVKLNIDNVKPNLFYGVKAADEVAGVAGAKAAGWVQADANGVLKGELKAEKTADQKAGFYTVVVTDDPAEAAPPPDNE